VRVLVLAAHPDDETLGAGALLCRAADVHVVHLTDGAPHDRGLWPRELAASVDRETYASIRREELLAALARAGVDPGRVHGLGFADQEAAHHLAAASRALASLLDEFQPELVITHPYEGGHPDHDAAAFVARAALRLQRRRPPELAEMTSYHAGPQELVTGAFLPSARPILENRLDGREAARKREMLALFASQREVLAPFGVACEPLRPAPLANFAAPPHRGPLHYERLGWALDGAQFRTLAARAVEELR
jgi:LmbE family N-acetylglucosaminyl deacetylase